MASAPARKTAGKATAKEATPVNVKPITQVTEQEVGKVYSGKPGCGCGCRGKYWVHPAHAQAESAERGYAYEGSQISLTQVRRILRLMQGRASEVKGERERLGGEGGGAIYAIEDDSRYYWLYTRAPQAQEGGVS